MPSTKFSNLLAMLERSASAFATHPPFRLQRGGQGSWSTYQHAASAGPASRGGLAGLGVKRGDRVAIISNNRPEWAISAYACFGLGASLVPMYEAQLPTEWAYICADCSPVAIIAATGEIFDKCLALPKGIPA